MALVLGLLGGWLPSAAPARAGSIVVTTLADPLGPEGTCSLRSAIDAANSDLPVPGCTAGSDADTITFAPGITGTITLREGKLNVGSAVTIEGPGANLLTISGGGETRVFHTFGESLDPIALTLVNLTVANGYDSEFAGGGVLVDINTSLTLDRAVVRDNSAPDGGGIRVVRGSLVVIDSEISGNTATQYNGGGISLQRASLLMRGSTVSGNNAPGSGEGGHGGGLLISGGGSATIGNSTFANNSATQGSGIAAINADVNLTHVTVAGSTTGSSALYAQSEGSSIGFRSTIVANAIPNCAVAGDGAIEAQEESLQYNSANPTDASCGATLPIADPRLDPLGNNGGPTPTMVPGTGSPAINTGSANCNTEGVDGVDQRGVARPQGSACDSGAVEVVVPNPTLTALATNPAPVVTSAGGTVTLTLDGTNFVQNVSAARIDGLTTINGGPIATTYVSATRLTATLPAFPAGTARSYAVTVSNAPLAGTSNALSFAVQDPVASPAPTPSPIPSPTPAPQSVVRASVQGNGTISPAGDTAYPTGGIAAYSATPGAGQVFLGWALDGQYVGFASPLDFTVTNNRTLVAHFTPRPAFDDVAPSGVVWEAITQLAARKIINGYGDGTYGPTDPVQRAQIAALIVRAMGWDTEMPRGPVPFSDLGSVDTELQRAIMILVARGIAQGYPDGTYNPNGEVTHAQAISLIARSMVQAGYWQQVTAAEDDGSVYPNIPAASPHRLDLLTYVKYAGGIPDRPANQAWADWEGPSSRGWTAQVLWQAYQAQFGVDRVP